MGSPDVPRVHMNESGVPPAPAAPSFHHHGRKEDRRGCYRTEAHRYKRGPLLWAEYRFREVAPD